MTNPYLSRVSNVPASIPLGAAVRRRLRIRELAVYTLRDLREKLGIQEAKELDAAVLDHAERALRRIERKCLRAVEGK